jgi:hypothetical protein
MPAHSVSQTLFCNELTDDTPFAKIPQSPVQQSQALARRIRHRRATARPPIAPLAIEAIALDGVEGGQIPPEVAQPEHRVFRVVRSFTMLIFAFVLLVNGIIVLLRTLRS